MKSVQPVRVEVIPPALDVDSYFPHLALDHTDICSMNYDAQRAARDFEAVVYKSVTVINEAADVARFSSQEEVFQGSHWTIGRLICCGERIADAVAVVVAPFIDVEDLDRARNRWSPLDMDPPSSIGSAARVAALVDELGRLLEALFGTARSVAGYLPGAYSRGVYDCARTLVESAYADMVAQAVRLREVESEAAPAGTTRA